MTLEELKSSEKSIVTSDDIASILKTDGHTIRVRAHLAPETLGFPVIVMKSRVKIPRIPFINFIEGTSYDCTVDCPFKKNNKII